MKKVSFYTLGCKVNQYETQAIEELFENSGYTTVEFNEFSDVYVINTCSVTAQSDRKSRQIIRRAKKINPLAKVVVTGCFAQTKPKDVLEIEGVNLVIGTKDRNNIVELVEKIDENSKVSYVNDIMKNHTFEDLKISTYHERTRAYIKIQEGCNQFCSYCIIPYARGPVRSRNFEDILTQTRKLVENGYTEVIYTGIHVASFGQDTGEDLAKLLVEADKIDGLKRIRLSSIEPMTLNEEFVEKISGCKKLCHHFHLSLQSGCDETLKRMNRKYTTKEYENIVRGLRKKYPDVSITTDIMVGFCGETDEEFEKTLEFVKKIKFSDAHIFKYSKREGTPAAKRLDQVDEKKKDERSKIIISLCEKTRDEFLSSFIGKSVNVLFEQQTNDGYIEGKTQNYITVRVRGDKDICHKYKDVKIKNIKKGIAYGELE